MDDRNLCITMLGTGHATTTYFYNTCFVLHENEKYFMVDAGGGNQILRILKEQGIPLTKIHDLFITHAHSDHILGAVWMIRMIGQLMNRKEYEGELNIYAHEQVIEGLKTICDVVLMKKITKLFGEKIRFVRLKDGDEHLILGRKVTFFDIQSKKLLQYGFLMKEESLIFCGDEPLKKNLYPLAEGMDYMLHEAFCLEAECEKFRPHEKHHSTVTDVCRMAEDLNIKNLVLMHTEDSHEMERKKLYVEEGKQYYSGNLFVPDDGERISIGRNC